MDKFYTKSIQERYLPGSKDEKGENNNENKED